MIDLKWHSVWEIVNLGAVKRNLSGADLSNANLQGVDFAEANLSHANLSHAILRHSNLDRANLTNTDLAGANISGVDLERANLKGAKLKSAIGRQSQSSSAVKVNRSNSTAIVEERPTTIQSPVATLTRESEVATIEKTNPVKPKKNVVGLFFLGLIASAIAGGYLFFQQNSNFSWQELSQKLQPWKNKVEQLIPID